MTETSMDELLGMTKAVAELHRKQIIKCFGDSRTAERVGAMLAVEEMIIECIESHDKYEEWKGMIIEEMNNFTME